MRGELARLQAVEAAAHDARVTAADTIAERGAAADAARAAARNLEAALAARSAEVRAVPRRRARRPWSADVRAVSCAATGRRGR